MTAPTHDEIDFEDESETGLDESSLLFRLIMLACSFWLVGVDDGVGLVMVFGISLGFMVGVDFFRFDLLSSPKSSLNSSKCKLLYKATLELLT